MLFVFTLITLALGWLAWHAWHPRNGLATWGSGELSPVGLNLRLVVGWTREQFIKTIRTGVDASNRELSEEMPWRIIGKMDDDELGALYAYLRALPPVQ